MDMIVPIQLADGTRVMVEASSLGGEQEVAGALAARTFDGVTDAIVAIANELNQAIARVRPTEAEVQFGLEFALESDKILALLVKGSGKSTLTITLKWATPVKPQQPA